MKSDLLILEKDLSYLLCGIFLKVGKEYGCFFKETIYQKACERELELSQLKYLSQPEISLQPKTGQSVGCFIPDLIVEDKIIVEIKAVKTLNQDHINQLMKYLEKSRYEIGYVVNFGNSYTQITRRIFTNDRKKLRQDTNQHEPVQTSTNDFTN